MSWLNFTLGLFLTLFGVASAAHALLQKRDPRSALGWVGICLVFPAFGPFLYWLFGVNRIHTRARDWQEQGRWTMAAALVRPDDFPRVQMSPEIESQGSTMRKVSDTVTRRPLTAGNCVSILHNGEQAYPAMLDAIRGAKRSVYLCTYIFDTDATGQRFIGALAEAAQRGIDVRVLVDGLGELYSYPRIYRRLRKRGIRAARFLPLRDGLYLNLRNHRKLLVIDCEEGFAGGMNIGDRHLAERTSNRRRVIDIHFGIKGPVVAEMEEAFLQDWRFATGECDPPKPARMPTTPAGAALCRAITSGPNEALEKLHWIILGALSAAKERIRIMTPYSIPDRTMISALNSATLRGVQVEIVLPRKNNLPYIAWATRALLWELLLYGVRIYDQPPPFVHSKYLLVDRAYALVGSANLDPRSLRLNFEFTLEIFDPGLTGSLAAHFDDITAHSRKVTLEAVDNRPLGIKLRDAAAKLFSPYL